MRQSLVEPPPTLPVQLEQARLPQATSTAPNALHALQRDVLEAVASGQPLERVAHLLCRRVEQLAPAVVCSVLRARWRISDL